MKNNQRLKQKIHRQSQLFRCVHQPALHKTSRCLTFLCTQSRSVSCCFVCFRRIRCSHECHSSLCVSLCFSGVRRLLWCVWRSQQTLTHTHMHTNRRLSLPADSQESRESFEGKCSPFSSVSVCFGSVKHICVYVKLKNGCWTSVSKISSRSMLWWDSVMKRWIHFT